MERELGLNAPYGAQFYLTLVLLGVQKRAAGVLMHLMALGAF